MRRFLFILFIKYDKDNQIKYVKIGRECSIFGRMRNTSNILVQKPDGKRPLIRPRCRWEDNIKTDLNKIGYVDVNAFNWLETGISDRLL